MDDILKVTEKDVSLFEKNGLGHVEVIMIEDEPWFIAKDVCAILNLKNSNDAIARLDSDEKGLVLNDTLGGAQQMSVVSEPGLYHLLCSCRVPRDDKARKKHPAYRFRRWVTHEVIPTIRKTGKYDAMEHIDEEHADSIYVLRHLNTMFCKITDIMEAHEKKMLQLEQDTKDLQNFRKEIDHRKPDDKAMNLYMAAEDLSLYSSTGRPHERFIKALAKMAGLNTETKKSHDDAYIQTIPVMLNNKLVNALYIKEKGMDRIHEWACKYLDNYKKIERYKKASEFHMPGDVKKCYYVINGTKYMVFEEDGSYLDYNAN